MSGVGEVVLVSVGGSGVDGLLPWDVELHDFGMGSEFFNNRINRSLVTVMRAGRRAVCSSVFG